MTISASMHRLPCFKACGFLRIPRGVAWLLEELNSPFMPFAPFMFFQCFFATERSVTLDAARLSLAFRCLRYLQRAKLHHARLYLIEIHVAVDDPSFQTPSNRLLLCRGAPAITHGEYWGEDVLAAGVRALKCACGQHSQWICPSSTSILCAHRCRHSVPRVCWQNEYG